jgi:hypothetical protein
MANTRTSGTSDAKPAAPLIELRNAVEMMDSLSQSGFSEIAIIAKLALKSLETPDGHRSVSMGDIAVALDAIWEKAECIKDRINSEAEQVGCNYVDEAHCRRMDAAYAARCRVSMDMRAPYGVYANGEEVATYDTESEANEHYIRLRTSRRKQGVSDSMAAH